MNMEIMGRGFRQIIQETPCCIGSAEKGSMKPICEDCGLGCYSVLVGYGIKG